jgi:hypothetical protein
LRTISTSSLLSSVSLVALGGFGLVPGGSVVSLLDDLLPQTVVTAPSRRGSDFRSPSIGRKVELRKRSVNMVYTIPMLDQEYLNIGNFDDLPVEEHGVLHKDSFPESQD